MRFLSLFSGIGGLDLGLERAGMECVGQVEIDEWATRVLSKHWPDVPRWSDIREFLGGVESGDVVSNDLRPDLICGGFPCQPVSIAGRRRGQDDERWLWPEMCRAVRIFRPRYMVAENVPGLFSRGFGDVLGDLAALGYSAEWDCIPAAAVGAPHLRYRVFIVAYTDRDGLGRQAEVGSETDQLPRQDPDEAGAEPHGASARAGCSGRLADDRGNRTVAESVADPDERRPDHGRLFANGRAEFEQLARWWNVEPGMGRVAHGIPDRVHRLRALGNAVVPQVAEYIGRRIMEREGV